MFFKPKTENEVIEELRKEVEALKEAYNSQSIELAKLTARCDRYELVLQGFHSDVTKIKQRIERLERSEVK